MKILITEDQLSKILSENEKQDAIINRALGEVNPSSRINVVLDDIISVYGFTKEELANNDKLYTFIRNSMIDSNWYRLDWGRYGELLSKVLERWSGDIISGGGNPLTKVNKLLQLLNLIDSRAPKYNEIQDLIQGKLDDVIRFIFTKYPPNEAIKHLSILKDKLGYEARDMIEPLVKNIAKKNGITIIPKHKGMTFEKKDGSMVKNLINYLKDTEKKSKDGFLDYINSRQRSRGQHSVFWSAVNQAGIIQKVRNGREITYQLGPNYQAWEDGKLVAF